MVDVINSGYGGPVASDLFNSTAGNFANTHGSLFTSGLGGFASQFYGATGNAVTGQNFGGFDAQPTGNLGSFSQFTSVEQPSPIGPILSAGATRSFSQPPPNLLAPTAISSQDPQVLLSQQPYRGSPQTGFGLGSYGSSMTPGGLPSLSNVTNVVGGTKNSFGPIGAIGHSYSQQKSASAGKYPPVGSVQPSSYLYVQDTGATISINLNQPPPRAPVANSSVSRPGPQPVAAGNFGFQFGTFQPPPPSMGKPPQNDGKYPPVPSPKPSGTGPTVLMQPGQPTGSYFSAQMGLGNPIKSAPIPPFNPTIAPPPAKFVSAQLPSHLLPAGGAAQTPFVGFPTSAGIPPSLGVGGGMKGKDARVGGDRENKRREKDLLQVG